MISNRILKIDYKEDIRRVPLIDASFESLQKQLCQLFNLNEGSFIIKYKDDEGDVVTIASQIEFKEALSCIQNKIVRLTIIDKEVKRNDTNCNWKEKCGRFKRWGGNCEEMRNRWKQHHQNNENTMQHQIPFFHNLKKMAFNLVGCGEFDPFLENILSSEFVKLEHNHLCDGCDVKISGDRYHCTGCQDFDFCSKCYEEKLNKHDPNHKFEKISALDALKEAIKNGEKIDSFIMPGKCSDNNQQKKIHHAFCDRCKQTIEGIRWKCFECKDFDFCNSCYLIANGKESIQSHLPTHSFAKIDDPQSYPKSFQKQKHLFQQEKKKIEKEKNENILLTNPNEMKIESNSPNDFPPSSIPPFQDFPQKLQDLLSMGFSDGQKNIRALIQNKGDLYLAIQQLLN